jgi:hypothetical protein
VFSVAIFAHKCPIGGHLEEKVLEKGLEMASFYFNHGAKE